MKLTDSAITVLEKRYLQKDENGNVIETPEDLFRRVAKAVASAENDYRKMQVTGNIEVSKSSEKSFEEKVKKYENQFYEIMTNLEFLPNSPTLFNAGKEVGTLSGCFEFDIEDSMESILDINTKIGLVEKHGGGVGICLSDIRPKDFPIRSTQGKACGAISVMRMIHATNDMITQGGKRAGAMMAIMRCDHPDIEEFITCKENNNDLNGFNISVAVTDAFMKAVEDSTYDHQFVGGSRDEYPEICDICGKEHINIDWDLKWNGEIVKTIKARDLFDLIVDHAWNNGDPGVFFIDEANRFNPTPWLGDYKATNPCVSKGTLIPTEKGFVRIENLFDDILVNGENKRCSVIKTGNKKVYEVRTTYDYKFKATEDHLVLTKNRGWVKVCDLTKCSDEWIGLLDHEHDRGDELCLQDFTIPFSNSNYSFGFDPSELYYRNRKKCYLPDEWNQDVSFIFGYLLGDGYIYKNTVGFSFDIEEMDVIEKVTKLCSLWCEGKEIKNDYFERNIGYGLSCETRYSSIAFAEFWKKIGFEGYSKNRKFPEIMYTAPKDIISSFLNGLYTADGSVNSTDGSIWYYSESDELLDGIRLLLLGFGIKSKGYGKNICINGADRKKFAEEIGFSSSKKQKTLLSKCNNLKRTNTPIYVTSVSFIGEEEVWDIHEPDTNSFIANGILVHNCGEQVLLSHESCNLGSINLSKFVEDEKKSAKERRYDGNYHCGYCDKTFRIDERVKFLKHQELCGSQICAGISHTTSDGKLVYNINWDRLKEVTELAVRFLDNVIDINNFPVKEIEEKTKLTRKIGLGVMGWADMLVKLGISYNSEEAVELAEIVMGKINLWAAEYSILLGLEKGTFPANFTPDAKTKSDEIRNATRTTIAPTGSLSIIAGCSSGIEPIFSLVQKRSNMSGALEGTEFVEIYPLLADKIGDIFKNTCNESVKIDSDIVNEILKTNSYIGKVFVTSHEISSEWHLKMQAAFQKHVNNAVSKTINLPNSATVEDINNIYTQAWKLKLKGITVYRDGSRKKQVLESISGKISEPNKREDLFIRNENNESYNIRPREDDLRGHTRRVNTGCGFLYVTINEDDLGVREVIATLGKSGGCVSAHLQAICRLISLSLKNDIDVKLIIRQLRNIRCPKANLYKGTSYLSCADAISKVLLSDIGELKTYKNFDDDKHMKYESPSDRNTEGVCPWCQEILVREEGCLKCHTFGCGYSAC